MIRPRAHWSEWGRATSAANSDVLGHLHRSVLPFGAHTKKVSVNDKVHCSNCPAAEYDILIDTFLFKTISPSPNPRLLFDVCVPRL
jgi:hypothetical protein